MKKLFYSSLLTISILGCITTAYCKLSIAVNAFNARGVSEHEAELIASRLRSRLVRAKEFRLLERSEMETILKEQGFQKTGSCSEQSCMVEIGQVLGVQKMISGTVGKIGRMYTITVRSIDVTTGQIEFSSEENCRCNIEEVYTKSAAALAEKVINYYQNPDAAPVQDEQNPIRRSKLIRQIALGTVSVGLAVGGIYFESKVRSINNQTMSELNDEEKRRLYSENQDNQRRRNLLFIGSGITALGFGISFFF